MNYIPFSVFRSTLLIGIISCFINCSKPPVQNWVKLSPPNAGENWIQPIEGEPAQPVWGHRNGMRIGIAPMPGPRGLLRIYTPYLGHKEEKMINFIAFEPIPLGEKQRGFSELEMSKLDSIRGKRFWSANDSLSTEPLQEEFPASGVIQEIDGIETLSVFIFSEPFDNGADVYVRLRFYENQPYEVEITTYTNEGVRELESFIVTATMGNFARLRTLYLKNSIKSSLDLWPNYKDIHFVPHDSTSMDKMIRDRNGAIYFIAAPDEEDLQDVEYGPDTNGHWKYYGLKATQYWYKEDPDTELMGLVNGRYTYWSSKSPIPNGISFENFELKEPWQNGAKFVFGVTPQSPEEFIKEKFDVSGN